VQWSPGLKAVIERLQKLGPDIRPTLLCNLQGKPFTESGFRSNWHRLIQKARARKAIADPFTFHDLRATMSPE
jgi:integrase